MININIQNLKCGGCANTITTKLQQLENVKNVEVNVESSSVAVQLIDITKVTEIKDKLSALGYPEENDANNLGKKAKSFVSCAVGRMSK